MSDALERLNLSRSQLRMAMVPRLHPRPSTPRNLWIGKFVELPIVRAVNESVGSWWSSHPLRPVGTVAGEASKAIVNPIAQNSPVALVCIAALLGAAVAWSRPWRWVFRSALFAGLVPQLASRVLSSLPIESWMAMLGSVLSRAQTPSHAEKNSRIALGAATGASQNRSTPDLPIN